MEGIVKVVMWLMENWALIVAGIVGVLTSLYGLFLVIPGEQPDKVIASILEFTKKWSKK